MVVIPKHRPVLENLNVYYLDVKKLLEHFQGEIGAGGVFFKSHAAEGVIFFDQNELINGFFRDKDMQISGSEAIERLLEAGNNYNFKVNIYGIGAEEVYYWAGIPSAEKIYSDLSTEFTDLEGLIKKMSAEKLTGYIDVSIGNGTEMGLIFLLNGKIIGGSYSWGNGSPSPSKKHRDLLIQKTKASGGSFNVSRIALTNPQKNHEPDGRPAEDPQRVIGMLEELLAVFEKVVDSKKKKAPDFQKMLKQKLVQCADRYAFLDPFAGEFEYQDRRINFCGQTPEAHLAEALCTIVKEMALELGLLSALIESLDSWSVKYAEDLTRFDIRF